MVKSFLFSGQRFLFIYFHAKTLSVVIIAPHRTFQNYPQLCRVIITHHLPPENHCTSGFSSARKRQNQRNPHAVHRSTTSTTTPTLPNTSTGCIETFSSAAPGQPTTLCRQHRPDEQAPTGPTINTFIRLLARAQEGDQVTPPARRRHPLITTATIKITK